MSSNEFADRPDNTRPIWAGPPHDELPDVLSLGQFFHKSARMVMAAKSAEVFSSGCLIEIVWCVRRTSESDAAWNRVTRQCLRGAYRLGADGGNSGALRFSVLFPDGRKATTAPLQPRLFDATDPARGPVLMLAGSGGSGNDDEAFSSSSFWLWPLPLDGYTEIFAQWDDLGMEEESIRVNGEQLAKAAANIQKYWTSPRPG